MNCANVAAECLDGSAGLAEGGSGFVVFSPLPRRRITSTKHIVQTLRVVSWLWCFKDMVGDASPASCQVKRSVIPGLSPSRRASSIPVGVNKKIAGNQSKHKQRPVRECSSCGSENLMWGAHKDGIWTAFYCKACRTGRHQYDASDMLLVKPRCVTCTKRASFGPADTGKPVRCKKHADVLDIDVRSKRCEAEGCKRQAVFGREGQHGRRTMCGQHRLVGDVNRSLRTCQFSEGCRRNACYGVAKHSPIACSKHRHEHHIDLLHAKCTFLLGKGRRKTRCTKTAHYGNASVGRRMFCSAHKKVGHSRLNVASSAKIIGEKEKLAKIRPPEADD